MKLDSIRKSNDNSISSTLDSKCTGLITRSCHHFRACFVIWLITTEQPVVQGTRPYRSGQAIEGSNPSMLNTLEHVAECKDAARRGQIQYTRGILGCCRKQVKFVGSNPSTIYAGSNPAMFLSLLSTVRTNHPVILMRFLADS